MSTPMKFDEESVTTPSDPSDCEFEHTEATRYTGPKKATSYLSQTTTVSATFSLENASSGSDLENAMQVEPHNEPISIWTWKTVGIAFSGFFLAFLNAITNGITYGFFLGYMGLDSYVMSSITALMKLPQVLLLPFGLITDCFPIYGMNRKPYLLVAWIMSAGALLAMSLKPLPSPFFCQNEDGSYNFAAPPCNPGIHDEKNWYVFPLFIFSAGIQLGVAAGEGLLLEYSQQEPEERRGQIKATMTMVSSAGALTSSLVIGLFMNSKPYLGTFDWGLSFSGMMAVCLVLVIFMIPITAFCIHEPAKTGRRTSCRAHIVSSWELVKKKSLSSLLFFAFLVQFLVSFATTAGPMVRSQWAHVKVLQQQLFGMAGLAVMILATWVYKEYFLQASWRKAIAIAVTAVSVSDSIPTFLAIFGFVRNQYFYLGEDVLGSIPMAVLQLVSNLMIIELAEKGREGLCYGLIGTFQHAALPVSTVISNQVFGLFNPKLSDLQNYLADTSAFRSTVGLSYVLTYSTSFLALGLLPMIPWQKMEASRRKKEWSSNAAMAAVVCVIPAACLAYGIIVLLLTSQPSTACLRWVGGHGCASR